MIQKATFTRLKLLEKSAEPDFAVWRGHVGWVNPQRHKWKVLQPLEDPCRLYIKSLDLEYAFGNCWESDGPSIPNFVCVLLGIDREDYLKSGFLHDFCHQNGGAYVRRPGGEWKFMELDKETADALLWAGMLAEGASKLRAGVVYLGVHTLIADRTWAKYREGTSKVPRLGAPTESFK